MATDDSICSLNSVKEWWCLQGSVFLTEKQSKTKMYFNVQQQENNQFKLLDMSSNLYFDVLYFSDWFSFPARPTAGSRPTVWTLLIQTSGSCKKKKRWLPLPLLSLSSCPLSSAVADVNAVTAHVSVESFRVVVLRRSLWPKPITPIGGPSVDSVLIVSSRVGEL